MATYINVQSPRGVLKRNGPDYFVWLPHEHSALSVVIRWMPYAEAWRYEWWHILSPTQDQRDAASKAVPPEVMAIIELIRG